MTQALSAQSSREAVLTGIACMCGAAGLFTIMDFLIKVMATSGYHTFQILFARSLFALIPVLWILQRAGGFRILRTRNPKLHALRCLFGTISMICFFTAYKYLPVSGVVALGFSAPLFMTALSGVLGGDKVRLVHWLAVSAGFAGVLYIVQPGGDSFTLWSLLPVIGAFTYAIVSVLIRRIGNSEPSVVTVFYFTSFTTLLGAASLPFIGIWPTSFHDVAVMVGVGLIGGVAQVLMTRAFTLAPVSVVGPFDYTAMLWAVGIEAVVLGVLPTQAVVTGSAIVIASGLYILYREARVAK
ncbi:DMT family transporter [Elstera cyanobacteriorum]|uniref:DMT family transporter n=1 Tax=Elstera cyanobacteriorum TaxID=2022747 RepID=UPI00235427C1|nr:DMT family transporter [Elstera cyanobacteriorum]MCK6442070.1 DMT family transporter [Elstera cyanobacteriorum]